MANEGSGRNCIVCGQPCELVMPRCDNCTIRFYEQRPGQYWQLEQSKNLIQNLAERHYSQRLASEWTLTFRVVAIAVIALASARIWIGVAGVLVFLAAQLAWSKYREKQGYRLDRYRQRFRELLAEAESPSPYSDWEMTAEELKFLRECADSILSPLAVPEHNRKQLEVADFKHIQELFAKCGLLPARSRKRELVYQRELETAQLCALAEEMTRKMRFKEVGSLLE
jgi:hypothetical protein